MATLSAPMRLPTLQAVCPYCSHLPYAPCRICCIKCTPVARLRMHTFDLSSPAELPQAT